MKMESSYIPVGNHRCSHSLLFLWLYTVFLLLDLITHEILSLNMNYLVEIKGLKLDPLP